MDAAMRGENFAVSHATPLWRASRKIASQNLSPKTLDEKIMPIQEAETFQLAYDLLNTPKDFSKHIKRTTASTASIVTFGHRASTYDSFWVKSVYTAMDDHISPTMEQGSYLPIEQFPILGYIPDRWAPSKARAKRCYEAVTGIWTEALGKVKERRRNGDERASLADRMLAGDLKSDVPMSPSELANFLGSITQGGADTTSSSMRTTVLHLAKHPRVQEKAQIELDRVCGTEKIPRWADFKDLPYINCIVKEGLRIRPV
jgi:cytochrome P450